MLSAIRCIFGGMKSWGRFILILLAYGIAMLHTVVPHHHAQVSHEQAVLVHNNCVFSLEDSNLLLRVLSTDLGTGHLEIFKRNADTEIEFSSRFIAHLPPLTFTITAASATGVHAEFIDGGIAGLTRHQALSSTTSFRGPPVG